MIANFHINYGTKKGEQIAIQLKRNDSEEIIICQSYDATNWLAAVQVIDNEVIEYRYVVQSFKGLLAEQGVFRHLTIPEGQKQVFYQDEWRAEYEKTRAFFSAAFKDVIFKRKAVENAPATNEDWVGKNRLVLQLYAADIPQNFCFCVVGDTKALGNWTNPIIMSDAHFPLWQAEIPIEGNQVDVEYKFAIYDLAKQKIVEWEKGANRTCAFTYPSVKNHAIVRTDECFRHTVDLWRGAGVLA